MEYENGVRIRLRKNFQSIAVRITCFEFLDLWPSRRAGGDSENSPTRARIIHAPLHTCHRLNWTCRNRPRSMLPILSSDTSKIAASGSLRLSPSATRRHRVIFQFARSRWTKWWWHIRTRKDRGKSFECLFNWQRMNEKSSKISKRHWIICLNLFIGSSHAWIPRPYRFVKIVRSLDNRWAILCATYQLEGTPERWNLMKLILRLLQETIIITCSMQDWF